MLLPSAAALLCVTDLCNSHQELAEPRAPPHHIHKAIGALFLLSFVEMGSELRSCLQEFLGLHMTSFDRCK